jgi:uncharacterized protein VirK/YbjX
MLDTRHFSAESCAPRSEFKDKALLAFGSILHPLQTYRWLQFLKSHPVLKDLISSSPHLISKIHKPYLSKHLKCSERVSLLIGHYEFMSRGRFDDLIKKATAHPITAGEFFGRSGALYQLKLSTVEAAQQEGEFILRLISRGVCIYTATFAFINLDGEAHVKVGSLRGFLATNDTMRIKQITRDLYGCRPKDLMVAIVREIGGYFECQKTLLISNKNKISGQYKRVCKKSSDYDLTWKELNAIQRSDGDFELPCTQTIAVSESNSATAPSPQRYEPPKRNALVDSIVRAIRCRLTAERTSVRYMFSASPRAMGKHQKSLNERSSAKIAMASHDIERQS